MLWFKSARRTCPARRSRRPELEVLEDRAVPSVGSTFTISNGGKNETAPVTASAANGSSVVVWSLETSAGNRDIVAQRYDTNHQKVGNLIVVANTDNDEFDADAAMRADGSFAVTWINLDSTEHQLEYALFDANGNTVKTGGFADGKEESQPHIAMSDAGKFAITSTREGKNTTDRNVVARRFNVEGEQLGAMIPVATRGDRQESDSRVDMASNGRFAVAYTRQIDNSTYKIVLARYTAKGQLLGKTAISKTYDPSSLDVGISNAGTCFVVYDPALFLAEDISLRKVSSTGAMGAKKSLADSDNDESAPRIAVDRVNGDFVLAYRDAMNDGSHVAVREFFKDGMPRGAEHVLSVNTTSSAINLDGLDRYFVAYESLYSPSDTDVYGAFGQLS